MHYIRAILAPFLFRNPHLFKARQTRQDACAAKHAVAPVLGSAYLDFHGGGGQATDVLFETLLEPRVQCRAAADYDVVVEVLAQA